MATVDNNVRTKLKFKITTKGIRADSGDTSCKKIVKVINTGMEHSQEKSVVKPSPLVSTKKRSPEISLVSPKAKTRKMDRVVKVQCGNILKELMKQSCSWVFREPVDPVKLNIPDYCSIISKPMDLGTIKSKLEKNCYSTIEEFSADVRLTFSNAMLYNSSEHQVHKWAMMLNDNFSKRWKSLEAKLKSSKTSTANDDIQVLQSAEKSCQEMKKVGVSRAPVCIDHDNRPLTSERRQNVPMSSVEKQNLRSLMLKAIKGKMTEKLRSVFQKFDLSGLKAEKVQSYIDATDNADLWELRKELKIVFGARAGKADTVKIVRTGSNVPKAKCQLCGNLMCHCLNAPDQAFSSDLSSGRLSDSETFCDSKLDTVVKLPMTCETIQSGPDSDGPGVVVNGSPRLSAPSATATSGEGWNTFDIPLSPKKALRAAMLKSRFASTIFKATHLGEKSDPLTMQQEREKLEKEQLEEKARIEREIKAAEAAMRVKAQKEMKLLREKEREAARIALQKMERTVEIYENHEILKELELLCYSPVGVKNPLEELGLHMKDDDYMDDIEDLVDGEEGEIIA